MGIGKTLAKESYGLVTFAFMLGVGLVVLGKFAATNSVACVTGYTYNSTANNCYLTTNNSVTASISGSSSTVSSIVTGLGDFADWIGIIVLVVVGVMLMAKWNKGKGY